MGKLLSPTQDRVMCLFGHVFQEETESHYKIEIEWCEEYTDISPSNFKWVNFLLT